MSARNEQIKTTISGDPDPIDPNGDPDPIDQNGDPDPIDPS